jgi:hypothetical protein
MQNEKPTNTEEEDLPEGMIDWIIDPNEEEVFDA